LVPGRDNQPITALPATRQQSHAEPGTVDDRLDAVGAVEPARRRDADEVVVRRRVADLDERGDRAWTRCRLRSSPGRPASGLEDHLYSPNRDRAHRTALVAASIAALRSSGAPASS